MSDNETAFDVGWAHHAWYALAAAERSPIRKGEYLNDFTVIERGDCRRPHSTFDAGNGDQIMDSLGFRSASSLGHGDVIYFRDHKNSGIDAEPTIGFVIANTPHRVAGKSRRVRRLRIRHGDTTTTLDVDGTRRLQVYRPCPAFGQE